LHAVTTHSTTHSSTHTSHSSAHTSETPRAASSTGESSLVIIVIIIVVVMSVCATALLPGFLVSTAASFLHLCTSASGGLLGALVCQVSTASLEGF
jgi:uncharacterized membrane protein